MDLSSIVPAEAKAVHLSVEMSSTSVADEFHLRRNVTYGMNRIRVVNQVANRVISEDAIISVDSDRKLDYYGNTGINWINIVVLGWYI